MKSGLLRIALLSTVILLFAGCATVSPEPEAPWTPSELTVALAGPDPVEPFNRSMFAVTNFVMDWIADPIGRVYTSIFPRPFIEKFNNLCVNLEFPTRAVSSLIHAQWKGSWDELCRFLINTTVGIAGLFDPAAYWFDIYSTESDFGQAFAAWGIGPGCTFMLPMMGTLNMRDTVGSIFDMAFDIKTYIPYAGYATALNRMVVAHRAYESVVKGSADKYKTYHELALLRRQLQLQMYFYNALNAAADARKAGIEPELPPDVPVLEKPEEISGNWKTIPGYRPQSPVLDTIRVAMFQPQNNDDYWYFRLSVFNRDFTKKCDIRKLEFAENLPKLSYAFWEAPEPEVEKGVEPPKPPLLLILPGIGGNHFGGTSTAQAELFHHNGYASAVVDSSFTWQFMTSTGSGMPGYLPEDAANLRDALRMVLEDLAEQYDPEQIILCGFSMGGLQVLKIAEQEEKEELLGISRFLAINPPVRLHYAMTQADRLSGVSEDWSEGKAVDAALSVSGRTMVSLMKLFPPYDPNNIGVKPRDYSVPLTAEQADYVAALYFKMSMRDLLFTAHRDRGLQVIETPYAWGRRTELFREIDRIGFEEYAEKIVAPERKDVTLEELYYNSSLYSIESALRSNRKIRVIHSADDFLLSPEDRAFLDRVLGDRITWFDRGGHLGNLYVTSVQQTLLEEAKK